MLRVRPIGWFYLPSSVLSWAVAAAAALLCVNVFLAVDRHSHSASDTLYGVFPYWAAAFLLWNWFASRCAGASR
jgi:hypothetical protein